MKSNKLNRLISGAIAVVLLFTATAIPVYAGDGGTGKYVRDVFIAYGKDREEAEDWLLDNGWEPIRGENDFCAGKNSHFNQSLTAAMGIRRTNNINDAITDMAVMNMKGGYSFPAYEELLEQKRADIDELINRLMDMINEYRDNFNGLGSSFGAERAKLAYSLLNRFYDGDREDEYAVNDTELALGELLLQPMRHEEGGEYGGDLQQILLESSGPVMLAVESLLSLATDTNEDSWLQRLSALSEETLAQNIGKYVPSAEGQNLPASAISNLLRLEFGDTAEMLAAEWPSVNEKMRWIEDYHNANDLWQKDGEGDEEYESRVLAHFEALKNADPDEYNKITKQYNYNIVLYAGLYDIPYSGSWGETLGDFFLPSDPAAGSPDVDSFLPMAAVLSRGQRSSLEYISLCSLLLTGMQSQEAIDQLAPDLEQIFDGELYLSVYTGVNRAIFRNGVAITSEALMEQNMGRGAAFDKIWDTTGIVAITAYCSAVVGLVSIIAGTVASVKGTRGILAEFGSMEEYRRVKEDIQQLRGWIKDFETGKTVWTEQNQTLVNGWKANMVDDELKLKNVESYVSSRTVGRVILGVGGALLLGAAIVEGIHLYKYYKRKFTPIPRMIVSESDIVTYLTDENNQPLLDENGNQKKLIEFKDYEYYSAVRCNRPQVGEISKDSWQDGVKDYQYYGCYDIADLNGDFGQEWLALYTVKSPDKGEPILADSLKLQYGSDKQPQGTTKCLHFFEYTYPMDMGDTAYSYNNKKGGVYFFWDEDVHAASSQTASVFSAGQLAIAAAGGLVLGAFGALLVSLGKRKKEKKEAK